MVEGINLIEQFKFASQHLFNLIVFIGILYYFLKDTVVNFFASRSNRIKDEIAEATNVISKSQEQYNNSSQKLELIDSELTELRNSLDAMTNRKVSDILDNANFLGEKIKNDTADIISLESVRLKADIENEVLGKAIELAKYEIKEDSNESKDTILISSFLSEVKQNAISNS
jgi:F0F1-type ATP synthase membrane subunit b/b'